jgi:hypothetical protein
MSNVLKFFVKRVCVFYALALLVCLIVGGQRLVMITSLTLGVFISLLRFAVLESVFRHLLGGASKNRAIFISLVIYLLNLVIIGITVVFAMQFGIYSFLAALAGTLSILIIVMINAVTEAFGITKNHYGQKVK